MLIDRSHYRWALFSGISFIAGTVSYLWYAWSSPKGPSGGTVMGLLYGVIGTAMMLFAGLLAARKPLRIRRIGSAQFWLKGHIWLGSLSVPFILFHSGFGWGGLLEKCLCCALLIVVSSGFFGLAMQQFLPRLLWNRTPLETFEGQTSYQCNRLTFIADLRVAGLSEKPLNVPFGQLTEHWRRLVRDYDTIANGPGARNEQNSKKLILLQQVSPPDARDFFWAMAKYAKSEAKVIRFEGDFPELLATTYVGLRAASAETIAPSGTAERTKSTGFSAPVVPTPKATPNTDLLVNSLPPESSSVQVAINHNDDPVPKAQVTKGIPRTISPLEMMKKKAEEKAKAAAEVTEAMSAPVLTDAVVQTAADATVDAAAANPSKLSPLEMIKKKAVSETARTVARSPDASSELQGSAAVQAEAVKGGPAKALPLHQLKNDGGRTPAGLAAGPASHTGGSKSDAPRQSVVPEVSVPPTAAEKFLIHVFYMDHVRPFLAENRSRRSVQISPLSSAVETRRLFHEKEAMLPALLHPLLQELQDCCEVRRQIELQRRILRWMHWWLMIHVPASVALLVLLVAHVFMALRVVPIAN